MRAIGGRGIAHRTDCESLRPPLLIMALYLTAASTSTEASITSRPEASPPNGVPAAAMSEQGANVEPQAAEASQIVANPLGVGKFAEKVSPAPHRSAAARRVWDLSTLSAD